MRCWLVVVGGGSSCSGSDDDGGFAAAAAGTSNSASPTSEVPSPPTAFHLTPRRLFYRTSDCRGGENVCQVTRSKFF